MNEDHWSWQTSNQLANSDLFLRTDMYFYFLEGIFTFIYLLVLKYIPSLPRLFTISQICYLCCQVCYLWFSDKLSWAFAGVYSSWSVCYRHWTEIGGLWKEAAQTICFSALNCSTSTLFSLNQITENPSHPGDVYSSMAVENEENSD